MKSLLYRTAASVLFVLMVLPERAAAQLPVIDDLILMTSRQQNQSKARTYRHLDPPGGENLLPPSPGADEPRLGEEQRIPLPLTFALSRRGRRRIRRGREVRRQPSEGLNPQSEISSLEGPLEVPAEIVEPANALSLSAAGERLVAANSDLAAKYQDISKARGEVLTAGLLNNPFLFVNVSDIPYGHFSPERPASTSYDLTLIQPLDVNGKRTCRLRAAQEAKTVLEAQFQDAIRLKLDRLGEAFVDVLEARQALRAQQAGLARLHALEGTIRALAEKGVRPPAEIDSISLERAKAELAIARAESTLLQARRELALLLGISAAGAPLLEAAGSLHDRAPLPPCVAELIRIALQTRPDLTAYHLGMSRAQADLRRENAESMDDIYLFYTPFNAFDFSPQGKQSVVGWGLGVLFSLPFFDRNQGEIARARVNVTQTRLELQGLERRIVNEVQYAATEYAVSRAAVEQYEAEMLAAARQLRDEQARLFANGQATLESVLEAQKEYDEIVREYLEMLVYHRRTMLRLNTAAGQRLLP